MRNCENYTILLNWLNNKYSEEKLFYISLKNSDFDIIQKCFEQIKETLIEFSSFVYDFTKEEQDVYAVRLINNKYCYEKIQINDITIPSISGNINSERYITLFKKTYLYKLYDITNSGFSYFYDEKDAKKGIN